MELLLLSSTLYIILVFDTNLSLSHVCPCRLVKKQYQKWVKSKIALLMFEIFIVEQSQIDRDVMNSQIDI